ncbi:hypothetical protein GIB67_005816 [Kingdonia uniflora]|uniref:Uncharacterized protein n=1 Tax=Kingdonia uniflora TaxID=39325 RepID=A0A7J7LUD5_9MAGN|nr:hypothetical protein GIB67_005816 [Kingdonia uniflora]
MVASVANFLDSDIYDLKLTSVKNNSDLHGLLSEIPMGRRTDSRGGGDRGKTKGGGSTGRNTVGGRTSAKGGGDSRKIRGGGRTGRNIVGGRTGRDNVGDRTGTRGGGDRGRARGGVRGRAKKTFQAPRQLEDATQVSTPQDTRHSQGDIQASQSQERAPRQPQNQQSQAQASSLNPYKKAFVQPRRK